MGLHCFKDKSGSAEPISEDSERFDLLHRQETELTEKQSRYLALVAQLEEEKAKVAAGRKDLAEALSEHEIFKSTLKELHTRLRECEEASSQRKDLEPTPTSSDSVTEAFQQELAAVQEQTQRVAEELAGKQRDLEQQHRLLRETEKTVTLLEKLERELEHQLEEEAFKHQLARKTAYLRGLFLLLVRKAQFRSMKMLLRWHMQARRRTVLSKQVMGIAWPSCPDLELLKAGCVPVPAFDLPDQVKSVLMRIEEETGEMYESWRQMYGGTEEEIRHAALISTCQAKAQDLDRLKAALENAIHKITEIKSIWNLQSASSSQALSDSLQGSKLALHELNSLSMHQLDAQLQAKTAHLLAAAQETQASCQAAKAEFDSLTAVVAPFLEDIFFDALNDSFAQIVKYKAIAELTSPQLIQLSDSRVVEESVVFEEESGEMAVVEETYVAAAPEEVPLAASTEEVQVIESSPGLSEPEVASQVEDSPVPIVLPSDLSPEDRESLLNCPTLKVLQLQPLSDIRILPISELLAALQALLKSVSAGGFRWESVLDYFVRRSGSHNAPGEIAELASNLSRFEEQPFIHLLATSLGLSLLHPTPFSQAYGPVVAAAALEGQAEDAGTGGKVALIETVKAVRRLFKDAPGAGQEALLRLKPDTLSDLPYLNFLLCARLKEIKKDSIQLFKAIDSDNSGKLTCEELVSGLHSKLDLWASADFISSLFRHIDKDGSGSISRIEFAREITFKTYLPLEKTLTITRLQFVEAAGPLLRPTEPGLGELAAETRAWLGELAGRRLVVG